jgi:hypothetical protein
VFPCALGMFSVKESLLVLRYDSYDAAERVFPCTLSTFSIKRKSVSLYFGYDLVLKSVSLYFGYI